MGRGDPARRGRGRFTGGLEPPLFLSRIDAGARILSQRLARGATEGALQMLEGSCLCGTVRYRAEGPLEKMARCHCDQCRKASGTEFATNGTVKAARAAARPCWPPISQKGC